MKKIDPDLPFHFVTNNDRLMDEEADFDDDNGRPKRLHMLHVNVREDASIFAAGRNFLPARDRQTIRQQLFRFDIGLPPVPQQLLPDLNIVPHGGVVLQ